MVIPPWMLQGQQAHVKLHAGLNVFRMVYESNKEGTWSDGDFVNLRGVIETTSLTLPSLTSMTQQRFRPTTSDRSLQPRRMT